MNDTKLRMAVPWGERTTLLPKAMVYGLSLDVEASSHGQYLMVEKSTELQVRHMFDESIVTMPEGLRCDVPRGQVAGGDGEVGAASDPTSCWLGLRVRSTVQGGDAMLYFTMRGVVNFDGGLSSFRNGHARRLTGSAFVASCQEASTGTYRWLERRQLFGVGVVEGQRPRDVAAPPEAWRLRFSFDLYAAL